VLLCNEGLEAKRFSCKFDCILYSLFRTSMLFTNYSFLILINTHVMGTLNSVYVISCKGQIVHREEEIVLGSFEVPYRSVEENVRLV